jgi:putative ABC transport system permease protein
MSYDAAQPEPGTPVCELSHDEVTMDIWSDIRFAARLLLKDRWFTLAAATALALGIGANAAVFTFVNAVLVRGLPFHEDDRIMAVWTEDERGRQLSTSELDYEDWRKETRSFSQLAATLGSAMNLSDEGRAPERAQGAYVTANLFRLIGQSPVIGRDFADTDDQPGAEPVTIIGHSIWQNRYEGDPAVLGRTLKVNSKVVTIVGVMPPDVRFPNNVDIWVPRAQLPPETLTGLRDSRNLQVIGRLADGVSVEQARVELESLGQRLTQAYPATNENLAPNLMPFTERSNGEQIRLVFLSLQGAVFFVLLIACGNVANLLLARAAGRSTEISIRAALGASRWRVVRQLLVESVMLACLAGAAGFGLAVVGVRWFDAATQEVGKPSWMAFTMDGTVFAFIAAVCLLTGVLFGLAPALHVSKTDVNEVLKEGGRGGTGGLRVRRWTRTLVIAELALTLVLLAGAGFMMRSFLTMYRIDLGLDTSRLLTMQIYLPLTKYPEIEPRTELFRRFDARLDEIPGIEASAMATAVPLGGGARRQIAIDGRPTPPGVEPPTVTMLNVGDRYFDALGVELLRGRAFTMTDGVTGQESAIVNQRFVAMHFPDEDPIGRRIRLDIPDQASETPESAWLTIAGVSPTIRQQSLQDPEPDPVVYVPHRTESPRSGLLLVRTTGDPAAATALVRDALAVIEPDLPLFNVQTLDQRLAQQRWEYQISGSMFATFALIALLLSAVGLYAVTAYSVTQRTQEIGLRMALGARPGHVQWLILGGGLRQLAVGLLIGVAGALGVGQLLQSLLVQTSPSDPTTLIGIVGILTTVAVLACVVPARRAAHLDPTVSLRHD